MKNVLVAVSSAILSGWLLTDAKASMVPQASGQSDAFEKINPAVIEAREYSNKGVGHCKPKLKIHDARKPEN